MRIRVGLEHFGGKSMYVKGSLSLLLSALLTAFAANAAAQGAELTFAVTEGVT